MPRISELAGSEEIGRALSLHVAVMNESIRAALSEQLAAVNESARQAVLGAALRPLQLQHAQLVRDVVVVPNLDLAELTGVRAALESFAANSVARTADQLLEVLRPLLPGPRKDLAALSGFEELAEGLSDTAPLTELAHLADRAEQVLPPQVLGNLSELSDAELLGWAGSVVDPTDDEVDDDKALALDTPPGLRAHLETVSAWLFTSALHLRAAAMQLDRAVDSVNERYARYDLLAQNILKLWIYLQVIIHTL